jgi:hypothetical protein
MEQIGRFMILCFCAFNYFFESFKTVTPSLLLIGIAQANLEKVSITFKVYIYSLSFLISSYQSELQPTDHRSLW